MTGPFGPDAGPAGAHGVRVAVFLASPAAPYIAGQVFAVVGRWTAR